MEGLTRGISAMVDLKAQDAKQQVAVGRRLLDPGERRAGMLGDAHSTNCENATSSSTRTTRPTSCI
jgi:hypothetical protein